MPSVERSETATRAPSRAIATAVARPMPDPPPVTNATFPSSMPVMRVLPQIRDRSPRVNLPDISAENAIEIKIGAS